MNPVRMLTGGLFTAALAYGASLSMWPVDSLVKVFPHYASGTSRTTTQVWPVARNGHTSVQFAVRSAEAVKKLNARITCGGGLQCEVRHVGYVPVSSNPPGTPSDEVLRPAPAFFPDPLFENFPYALPANRTDAIWVTVYAPASTRPGVYDGEAVVESAPGQTAATSKFQIRVAEAAVPDRQTLKVTNWFNTEPSHLAHYYKLTGAEDERYWELLGNIGRVMAAHKQNLILTPVMELATPRVDNGKIVYSFDRLDQWVETFEKAGLPIIEGGHLLGRVSGYQTPLRVPAYVIEDGKPVVEKLEPNDPRAEQYLHSFLSALYAHLKERGWTGRYVQHIHDEPHGDERPEYTRFGKLIRSELPGIPTVDAVSLDQDLGFFVADIWVPVLGSFDKQIDKIRNHVSQGGQAWFYTCIAPQGRYMNRFTDLPLVKTRLLHWMNFRYDFSGFLHWGGNYWSAEPFDNVQPVINDGTTLLPAGDNAIVYPAPEKYSILSSIRLEAMREGIEDYELLVALSKKDPAKARQLAAEAIPHFTDYVRDVETFRKLQSRLLGL